ncbi:MAG: hypothetical protein AAFX94_20605, partial [Myxococcota bacterium]
TSSVPSATIEKASSPNWAPTCTRQGVSLNPPTSALHVKNYGDAIRPDRLYSVPGRIRIDYEDDAGDRAKVDIVVADGSGPSVQVSATDADLWAFLGGGAALSQLVRTRVRIDGDVAYLLSVVSIIEP